MQINPYNYIIVTPCRNEEKNLPNLLQSILAQTTKPCLWVVVDDASTDTTLRIIFEIEKKYDWIKGVYLKEKKKYMEGYAYVCNKGFDFAEEYSQTNGLCYAYIALVDADNILEHEYFEKLINEFEKDPKLGIVSGNDAWTNIEKVLGDLRKEKSSINVMDPEFWQIYYTPYVQIGKGRVDLPIGSARMWRKTCFKETGGYLQVSAPDSVSNLKAKLRGWKIQRLKSAKVIERRASVKYGFWKGYNEMGKQDFFLWYPITIAFLKATKILLKKPHYHGIAYIYGYIKAILKREKHIEDEEIKQYYQNTRPGELRTHYIERVKKWSKILSSSH